MAAQKKQQSSGNGEFKTVPFGFDKNEVMAYIVNHNKTTKTIKEENESLKLEIQRLKEAVPPEDLYEEIESKKAELTGQIAENRKQVFEAERKAAQLEKDISSLREENARLRQQNETLKSNANQNDIDRYKTELEKYTQDLQLYKAECDRLTNELDAYKSTFEKYRKESEQYRAESAQYIADAEKYKTSMEQKLKDVKKNVGTLRQQQLADISSQASSKANAIIEDAREKAGEIIESAKLYAAETVSRTDSYKTAITENLDKRAAEISIESEQIAPEIDVNAILDALSAKLTEKIDGVIKSSVADAVKNAHIEQAVSKAKSKMLAEQEEVVAARAEIAAMKEFDTSQIDNCQPMTVDPYEFQLQLELPELTDDDTLFNSNTDKNSDISMPAPVSPPSFSDDFNALLRDSDFNAPPVPESAVSASPEASADVDGFASLSYESDAESAQTSKVEDFADLLADFTPDTAHMAETEAEKSESNNDFASLLTDNIPAPKQEETPVNRTAAAADDFESLLTDPALMVSDDDFSSLLADPVSVPAADQSAPVSEHSFITTANDFFEFNIQPKPAKKSAEVNLDDDFTSLLTEPTPSTQPVLSNDGANANVDENNKDDAMEIKEQVDSISDPWKELETQMNKMAAEQSSDASNEAKDTMSGSDFNMSFKSDDNNNGSNTTAFDTSWDFKLTQDASDDENDEMSSDNVGFFDL